MNLTPSEKKQLENWVKDDTSYQALLAFLAQKNSQDVINAPSQAKDTHQDIGRVFKNSPLLVHRVDEDGRFLYANQAVADAFDLPIDAIIGKLSPELGFPDHLFAEYDRLRKLALKTGTEQRNKIIFRDRHYQSRLIPEINDGQPNTLLILTQDVTSDMQLQQVMQEQDDRIDRLEHVAQIGSWELNLSTNELSWSAEFYNLCGIDHDVTPTLDLMSSLTHPDDIDRVMQVVADAIDKSEPYQIEKRIIRPDGQMRWVETRGEFVTDPQTQTLKMIGIFSDITNRKQAELAREKSEARATALLDAIPDLVFRFNKEGEYLDFHGDASRLLDNNPNVLGKKVSERLGSDLGKLYQDTILKTLESGDVQIIEYDIISKDEKRIIEARFVQSSPNEVTALMRDVTINRYRERELRNNELQYRSLLDAMVEGVILQGADREVLMCNDAACDILGTTREQLLKPVSEHPDWKFIDIDGTPLTTDNYPTRVTARTGEPVSNIIIGFTHPLTGVLRWLKVNVRAILDPDTGAVDKTVLSFVDITEERQAEEDRINSVIERERISLLNGFIQMASHEFRTPLSVILTNLHLLSRLTDEERRKEKIERINLQIKRLDNLIEMQLLMTKLDSGIKMRRKPHNISLILSQLVMLFDPEIRNKSITVETSIQPDLRDIMIDADYFSQCLYQILKNAITHSFNNGKLIINIQQIVSHTIITIRDTGVGLAEEDLPFVLERFWRKDKAHTDAGFGLGLALARQILALHGGTITLLSALNEGTTVTIILPLLHEE